MTIYVYGDGGVWRLNEADMRAVVRDGSWYSKSGVPHGRQTAANQNWRVSRGHGWRGLPKALYSQQNGRLAATDRTKAQVFNYADDAEIVEACRRAKRNPVAMADGAGVKEKPRQCWNSKTRDFLSGAEAERGVQLCSRCGQYVKVRVHWPKREGDYPEGTMAAHPAEKPRKRQNPAATVKVEGVHEGFPAGRPKERYGGKAIPPDYFAVKVNGRPVLFFSFRKNRDKTGRTEERSFYWLPGEAPRKGSAGFFSDMKRDMLNLVANRGEWAGRFPGEHWPMERA